VTRVEKRKVDRFSLELQALLSINDENEKHRSIEVMTGDICSGGAFFRTNTPFSVGTNVKIDLTLPSDKFKKLGGKRSRINVSGSVIRTNTLGMAVCFDKKYRIEPY
jgi:Tfp pilus assembly protein PilZ